ncbi:MAG: hypothetical protein FWC36_01205 [Spirochaetes bacterium]|nr:hypothetical protein [Spirochaetota bacterium]
MLINLLHADVYTEIIGSGRSILIFWCDHWLMKGCMEDIFAAAAAKNGINKN